MLSSILHSSSSLTSRVSCPSKLTKKRLTVITLLLLLLFCLHLLFSSSRHSGGPQGFVEVFTQCLFKSYASQNEFSKSDKTYYSVSQVLENGSGYFNDVFPTDKADRHNYTKYYDLLLQPYLTKDVNILEVGVKKGGSMVLWRELFSWDSYVYGIDIDPSLPTFIKDSHIKTLVMDTTVMKSKEVARALRGLKFDIILDDGNHLMNSQRRTIGNLLPLLKDTGVYIVEDALYPDWTYTNRQVHIDGPQLRYRVHADLTVDNQVYNVGTGKEFMVVIYGNSSIAPVLQQGLVKDHTPHVKRPPPP